MPSGMHATCLLCTLKRSPEQSNAESLAERVLAALREQINGGLCDVRLRALQASPVPAPPS